LNTVDHLYLSPHLDDVVFSCGGLIHRQCAEGARVLVVTAFTASPAPGQLSNFDKTRPPADWQACARAEDKAALEALGADFMHLGYHIAMHRQDDTGRERYPGVDKYGPLCPADADLGIALRTKFEHLRSAHPTATLYIPLSIGGHVDHVQVNQAARHLAGPLRFYEDFPYVFFGRVGPPAFALLRQMARMRLWRPFDKPDANAHPFAWPLIFRAFRTTPTLVGGPKHAHRQHTGFDWQAECHPIDLTAKIRATAHYNTQIDLLFGDKETSAHALTLYAHAVSRQQGTDTPCERLWFADR